MTRVICNQCRKEELPDGSLAPVGWFSTWRRGSGVGVDLHFCSPACGATYFRTLTDEEATAALRAAEQQAQQTTAIETGLRLQ